MTEKAPRASRKPRRPTGLRCGVLQRMKQRMQNGASLGLRARPENAAQKRGMTLGTHISRTPNWPAARCCGTRVRSDAQRDQWAAGPREDAPTPSGRSCSETKKCGHTAPIPPPKPKRLRSSRAAGTPWSCTRHRAPVNCRVLTSKSCAPDAWRAKIAGEKSRDPPHPHRPGTRPGRHWSLHDGRGERCGMGHLRPRAGPCGRSEAAESWCGMAAAHGAGDSLADVSASP